jgi:lycopene beta-cyclase
MLLDPTAVKDPFDLVLVGGGLHNGLIALATLHTHPRARIAMIEAQPTLGGNHTWCVHASDVPASARAWFGPLIVHHFPEYEVSFPTLHRCIASSYSVVSSERFAQVLKAAFEAHPQCHVLLGRRAEILHADRVTLDDGQTIHARNVIDARGPDVRAFVGRSGYQKFVGRELQTRAPHGLTRPILMDATCAQSDGYRFFYVLPFATDRLLIEETRFSLSPRVDLEAARAAVNEYAARFGAIEACVREETGVLPMPWSIGDTLRDRHTRSSPLVAGYRGGYFHPATGYSLPAAVRVAELIGAHALTEPFGTEWQRFVRRHRAQVSYALQLNRLLFSGFAETDMWAVLERFYRLPPDLIARFYALSSTLPDRARILIGRPPRGFSLRRALTFAGGEA